MIQRREKESAEMEIPVDLLHLVFGMTEVLEFGAPRERSFDHFAIEDPVARVLRVS